MSPSLLITVISLTPDSVSQEEAQGLEEYKNTCHVRVGPNDNEPNRKNGPSLRMLFKIRKVVLQRAHVSLRS